MRLTSLQEAANQREALHRKRPNVSGVPSRCGKNTSKQSKKLRQTLDPMKITAKVIRPQTERR